MRVQVGSVKEFREKYFSAESRLQRVFLAVPAHVSPGEWRLTAVGKTTGTPLVPDLRQTFFLD